MSSSGTPDPLPRFPASFNSLVSFQKRTTPVRPSWEGFCIWYQKGDVASVSPQSRVIEEI